MTTTQTTRWLTRQQAADRAGVKVRTLDRWLASGLLTKHVYAGRHVRVSGGELADLLRPEPVPDRTDRRTAHTA